LKSITLVTRSEFTESELPNSSPDTHLQHWVPLESKGSRTNCEGPTLNPQSVGSPAWNCKFITDASPTLSTNSNGYVTPYTTVHYNPPISVLHAGQYIY